MNRIEITPIPPITYIIKTAMGKKLVLNPTPNNPHEMEEDIEETIFIVTLQEAIEVANRKQQIPVITIREFSEKLVNSARIIELEENEVHWIDNETEIIILPKRNIYILTSTIEITYLNEPPQPNPTPIYTDIILLTQNTKKQHIIKANIHPQYILTPTQKTITVTRHLATLHITQKKQIKDSK